MIKRLPRSQKKIIIATLVGVAAFSIFWYFIYSPSQRALLKIKPEVYTLESQVRGIERVLSQTKTVEASTKLLKDRFQELNTKIFQKEARGIGMLSDLAKRLNIEVVSVKQQEKTALMDENNEKIEFSGKVLQSVGVSMEMRCFYKDLVKYLETLQKTLPGFTTVEKLRISRVFPKNPRLNVALDINLYTLF